MIATHNRSVGAERVLVVDDDYYVRSALTEALTSAGYGVDAAGSGEEALAMLEVGRLPSLIVLDLVMPGVDGWSFTAELKASESCRRIPIVVMTAHGERTLRGAPVSAGYMLKPLDLDELLGTVRRCIDSSSVH